ncbi:MAG: hypothetical protein K9J06_10505 [Flavobacteriales bacterium]|nr:hypothetical protein [Flavobacteriales bacterium]
MDVQNDICPNGIIRVRTLTGIRPVDVENVVMVVLDDRRPVLHVWNGAKACMDTVRCTSRSLTACARVLGPWMLHVRRDTVVNEWFISEVTWERIVKLKVNYNKMLVMGTTFFEAYQNSPQVF